MERVENAEREGAWESEREIEMWRYGQTDKWGGIYLSPLVLNTLG